MKKSELKHGMIVETTGGRYGIVVIKDATNENCIKFLYDPNWLVDNGCLYNSSASIIEPLDRFDDDLNYCYPATAKDVETWNDVKIGDKLVAWQIIRVFNMDKLWERNNLKPTCGGLIGDLN
jgi:hypothetical protein